MMTIERLHGTEQRLYQLVAPLVMDPKVLKQNYNFPFRTADNFEWFVAVEDATVRGFIPLEKKKGGSHVINNYYIVQKDESILHALLTALIATVTPDDELSAVVFNEDRDAFAAMGFCVEKSWTRYLKMKLKRT